MIDYGEDDLIGGKGDDYLHGGSGGDDLRGGSGDDILRGSSGGDEFDCGSGDDTILDYDRSEGDSKDDDCEDF
jgi:Ca2+-binding RTX toxin-like protein